MANILPWKPNDPLQHIKDEGVQRYARNKQDALDIWQRVNYAVGLYEYAFSRLVPLHVRIQRVVEQYPELEPVFGDATYTLAKAIRYRIESYVNGNTPFNGFDDEAPPWLKY